MCDNVVDTIFGDEFLKLLKLITGKLERTVVASSDDHLTEDEGSLGGGDDKPTSPNIVSDSDDDVPLVQLGRDFLSETKCMVPDKSIERGQTNISRK